MNLNKVTVDDINVKGKRVLVRVDFNVPLKDGVITNDNRITAALPTIKKLIADGGKVILCSHLGKPKNGPEAKFSLAPVAVRLSELLGKEVIFADDDEVVGENAKKGSCRNEGRRCCSSSEYKIQKKKKPRTLSHSHQSLHLLQMYS